MGALPGDRSLFVIVHTVSRDQIMLQACMRYRYVKPC
jgi:hypothetical protein